eukprot:2900946-Pyramimonas_sp.AAC.1
MCRNWRGVAMRALPLGLWWSSVWGHETCEGCANDGEDDDDDGEAILMMMVMRMRMRMTMVMTMRICEGQ